MNFDSKLFIQLTMYHTNTSDIAEKNVVLVIPYADARALANRIEPVINKYFIKQRLSRIKYTYHPFKTNTGNEIIVYVVMCEKDLLNDYKTLQRIEKDYVLSSMKSEIEACLI